MFKKKMRVVCKHIGGGLVAERFIIQSLCNYPWGQGDEHYPYDNLFHVQPRDGNQTDYGGTM